VHGAVARERERVDGEIAPRRVGAPVAAEADDRVAPEGLDVLAQGRHLEPFMIDHDGDGAVLDAGGHRLEAGRLRAPHHFVRQRRGGEVDFASRLADQNVAHGAADDAGLLAVAIEHVHQLAERAACEPRRVGDADRLAPSRHFDSPGTNFPSSTWAGT